MYVHSPLFILHTVPHTLGIIYYTYIYTTHVYDLKKLPVLTSLRTGGVSDLEDLQCLLPSQYHDSINQVGRHDLQHKHNEIVHQFVCPYRSIGVPQTGVEWILVCVSFSFGQHFTPSQANDVSLGYIVARHCVVDCITIKI